MCTDMCTGLVSSLLRRSNTSDAEAASSHTADTLTNIARIKQQAAAPLQSVHTCARARMDWMDGRLCGLDARTAGGEGIGRSSQAAATGSGGLI